MAALDRLLELPDMDIIDHLQGRSLASDAAQQALVQRLQYFQAATFLESQ